MSKIKIITDAASDISSEDELKYGIRVIPFQVTLGDESYTTRVDMDNAQFYARMAQCDEIPKTAQVNPFQFQEIYLREAQAGYTDLILVLINSEGSATYGNSLLAAEQFFEEHPEYRDPGTHPQLRRPGLLRPLRRASDRGCPYGRVRRRCYRHHRLSPGLPAPEAGVFWHVHPQICRQVRPDSQRRRILGGQAGVKAHYENL